MFPVYGVGDAPRERGRPARTMFGTALALSATRIDRELRRRSPSPGSSSLRTEVFVIEWWGYPLPLEEPS